MLNACILAICLLQYHNYRIENRKSRGLIEIEVVKERARIRREKSELIICSKYILF